MPSHRVGRRLLTPDHLPLKVTVGNNISISFTAELSHQHDLLRVSWRILCCGAWYRPWLSDLASGCFQRGVMHMGDREGSSLYQRYFFLSLVNVPNQDNFSPFAFIYVLSPRQLHSKPDSCPNSCLLISMQNFVIIKNVSWWITALFYFWQQNS